MEFSLKSLIDSKPSDIEAAYNQENNSTTMLFYKNSPDFESFVSPGDILRWVEKNAEWCENRKSRKKSFIGNTKC